MSISLAILTWITAGFVGLGVGGGLSYFLDLISKAIVMKKEEKAAKEQKKHDDPHQGEDK